MIRKTIVFLIFLTAALAGSAERGMAGAPMPVSAPESARYFSTLPDIPLMPGLTELSDQTVVFDKPEGRIVESVALIRGAAQDAVVAFYEQTLPQLGWVRAGPLAFVSEREFLKITFEEMAGRTFMRLAVSPAGATTN